MITETKTIEKPVRNAYKGKNVNQRQALSSAFNSMKEKRTNPSFPSASNNRKRTRGRKFTFNEDATHESNTEGAISKATSYARPIQRKGIKHINYYD